MDGQERHRAAEAGPGSTAFGNPVEGGPDPCRIFHHGQGKQLLMAALPGLKDPVFDSQRIFRRLAQAMSLPGTVATFEKLKDKITVGETSSAGNNPPQ